MTNPGDIVTSVEISTGARLHFGLLASGAKTGRRHGGAGLMVQNPGWTIRVAVSACDELDCPNDVRLRIISTLARCRAVWPRREQPPPVRIEIVAAVPQHVGLGAGTQLELALVAAWMTLRTGLRRPAVECAFRAGRGLRSALGIHGFERGGFLVEGGKYDDASVSPLVARAEFPEDWRLVLVRPAEVAGLSGEQEDRVFLRLRPMPRTTTEALCRNLVMDWLPAIVEADFARCSAALYAYGQTVGKYFAPVQGGVFADALMRRLAGQLRRAGVEGLGQSSWGPTLCILCESPRSAKQLVADFSNQVRFENCVWTIAAPRNCGATINTG